MRLGQSACGVMIPRPTADAENSSPISKGGWSRWDVVAHGAYGRFCGRTKSAVRTTASGFARCEWPLRGWLLVRSTHRSWPDRDRSRSRPNVSVRLQPARSFPKRRRPRRVRSVISNWTGRLVFCCMTTARGAIWAPWVTSRTRSFTRSQARSLESMARLNSA